MAYSVKRLAERWECSERHIYNMIASGHLSTFSIGTKRGTRISDEEVTKWESSQKSHTGTGTPSLESLPDGTLPTSLMLDTGLADLSTPTESPQLDVCENCGCPLTWVHDHKPDQSGLDDGPYLPGCAPRKKPAPKSSEEMREIRARAWATRRAKHGKHGHR